MRFVVIVFLLSLLAGCASVSPSYTYRPANYNGPAWSISANVEKGVFKDKIFITINGETIMSGTLHDFKSRDNFRGAYLERQLLAECGVVVTGELEKAYECTVFVDNERVAFLKF